MLLLEIGRRKFKYLSGSRGVALVLGVVLATPCAVRPVWAERIEFEAERTQIVFHLDSTLHEIEGSAQLSSGQLEFSPEGGLVHGRIVIDARSLDTGNGLRDGAMHKKLLESERFPTIELSPTSIEIGPPGDGLYPVVLSGELDIHGGRHPLEIRARVSIHNDEARIRGSFQIPHVAWGMRDMSNLFLNVDKSVTVEIDAIGRIRRSGDQHLPTPLAGDEPTGLGD